MCRAAREICNTVQINPLSRLCNGTGHPAVQALGRDAIKGCELCKLFYYAITAAEYELLRPAIREGMVHIEWKAGGFEVYTDLRGAELPCIDDLPRSIQTDQRCKWRRPCSQNYTLPC
jgi:hypothetical protein